MYLMQTKNGWQDLKKGKQKFMEQKLEARAITQNKALK
jgi:hypothetical protein